MIILTAIVTTVVVSVIWLIGIVGVTYFFTKNTPSFAVKITAPPQAEVAETVFIEMEISNPTDQSLTLSTIGLTDSLLGGFKVTSISPSAFPYEGYGSTTYEFSKTIASGGSMHVTLLLEATKPGVWTGDVNFSDPSLSFVTSSTTIRVNAAGSNPDVAKTEKREPPFVLGIDTPHRVALGENFTLRVSVTNPTDSPLLLEYIDLGSTLHEGFELQSVSPEPKVEGYEEIWSVLCSKSLLPGETFATEFVIKAVKEGVWTGDLDFWDQDAQGFVSTSVTIRVNPPASRETATPD